MGEDADEAGRRRDAPEDAPDASALAALRSACTGPVFAPHSIEDFLELAPRRRDGLRRRLAVVGAVVDHDVVRSLHWAAAHDVLVAVPGSGHVGDPDRPTLVVTRSRIDAVVVDPQARRLHAGVGATWAALRAAAAVHGLAADVPDLPVPLADSHTTAFLGILRATRTLSLTLVTGDGVVHRVDRETEPDLWWTLERGTDRAGVLTGVEMDLDTAPPSAPAVRGRDA